MDLSIELGSIGIFLLELLHMAVFADCDRPVIVVLPALPTVSSPWSCHSTILPWWQQTMDELIGEWLELKRGTLSPNRSNSTHPAYDAVSCDPSEEENLLPDDHVLVKRMGIFDGPGRKAN